MTRRIWLIYLGAGLAATAAYLAVPALTASGQLFNLIGLSAVVAIAAGIRLHRPSDARPWYLLALGQGLFVAGDVVAYNYPALFGSELPFPSLADGLYLAVYPAIVVGLFLLIRRRSTGNDRTPLVDTAILLVGAVTLSWIFLIAPYASDPSLSTPLKLTSIAYPVMDLALLAMVFRLAFGSGRREASFRMLILGAVSLMVTDAVFGWLLLNTDYQTGGPLDLGWALFYLLLGASALHPSMARLADAVPQEAAPRQRLALLAAASLLGPALQLAMDVADHPVDPALLAAGSAAMFILVLVRMRRLMVDLGEHRKTEERLFEAQETYRTLIAGLPAVVYSAELGGDWLYVSPQVGSVLGITEKEWLADPFQWEHRVHPEDLPKVLGTIRRCFMTGERFLAEYRFRHADGGERWIRDEASVTPPAGPGDKPAIRGVMYDVTEQHLAEEGVREALEREQAASRHLRELDDMKNAILNAVSHELRTPLTSILGMSRILQDHRGELPVADAELLVSRIGVNAERLSRLISDLLDLDRLSRGILEPNRQMLDIPRAVARLIDETHLDGRRLNLDVQPITADIDAAQFERIVVNLVTNAVRYTPAASPIRLGVTERPGGILIVVEDEGAGVPDHLKDSIFQPFEQGDVKVAHSPGVGIGLSLVAKFADLHGGRAWVEDRPGGGASFRVFLASEDVRLLPDLVSA